MDTWYATQQKINTQYKLALMSKRALAIQSRNKIKPSSMNPNLLVGGDVLADVPNKLDLYYPTSAGFTQGEASTTGGEPANAFESAIQQVNETTQQAVEEAPEDVGTGCGRTFSRVSDILKKEPRVEYEKIKAYPTKKADLLEMYDIIPVVQGTSNISLRPTGVMPEKDYKLFKSVGNNYVAGPMKGKGRKLQGGVSRAEIQSVKWDITSIIESVGNTQGIRPNDIRGITRMLISDIYDKFDNDTERFQELINLRSALERYSSQVNPNQNIIRFAFRYINPHDIGSPPGA